jgi:hypothetical protein
MPSLVMSGRRGEFQGIPILGFDTKVIDDTLVAAGGALRKLPRQIVKQASG